MIEIITDSSQQTKDLAQIIGAVLRGGEILELISDVGGGKTTFVKGLARGLQIEEVIQSPTFTISRLYKARNGLELHHFDFYRLATAGVLAAELAESLEQPNVVVAIEWGEIVEDVLPQTKFKLQIISVDENRRRLVFDLAADLDYIKQAIIGFKDKNNDLDN